MADDDLRALLTELENARVANDVGRLKFLLKNNNRDEKGRKIVTDYGIIELLCDAAVDDRNGVDVCDLLWKALSDKAKQQNILGRILCAAVESGNQEKILFFLDVCKLKDFINEVNGPRYFETPLYLAIHSQRNTTATCRLLLERGANAKGDRLLFSALLYTVDNTVAFEVCRLLLEHGADPQEHFLFYAVEKNNAPVAGLFLYDYAVKPSPLHIGKAISEGKEDVLSTFLQHDACPVPSFCRGYRGYSTPDLSKLLNSLNHTHQTKRNICRILIEHANSNHANSEAMMKYIYAMLGTKANHGQGHFIMGQGHCAILIDAGMDPTRALGKAVDAKHASLCRWLVQDHGANPFQECSIRRSSPFLKSACIMDDTTIFDFLFPLWKQRFSDGVRDKGTHPLHALCRKKGVTSYAITAVMEFYPSAILAPDHEGYIPVELAAEADASLDVIYELLNKKPAALINKGKVRPSKDAMDAQIASLQKKVDSQQAEIEKLRAENRKLRATRDPQEEPANKKAKTNHY